MKTIYLMVICFFLSSCAAYINKMHRQMDAEEAVAKKNRQDRFEFYRNKRARAKTNNLSRVSSKKLSNLPPTVRRKYLPKKKIPNRFNADDLNDNNADGSLWGNLSEDKYLFSTLDSKNIGDIVIINVLDTLKNEITMELKKAFPLILPKKSKKIKKGSKKNEPAKPAKEEKDTEQARIHDKISSIIIEKIGNQNYLIRGRKYVLFRNKKREVEVQALIAKTSITDENRVNSNEFLEFTIDILR